MTKHYSYSRTVQHLSDWGRNEATEEDAARKLVGTIDVSGAAMIALLGKLFEIGEVLRPDRMEQVDNKPPKNAAVIDGLKVGDRHFTYDCESGLYEYVITHIDENKFAKQIQLGSSYGSVFYVTGGFEKDKTKAIAEAIAEVIEYHTTKLADINRLKAMFERGENVDGGTDTFEDKK